MSAEDLPESWFWRQLTKFIWWLGRWSCWYAETRIAWYDHLDGRSARRARRRTPGSAVDRPLVGGDGTCSCCGQTRPTPAAS